MKKLILLLCLIAATAQAQYTPPQSSNDLTSIPVNTGGWTEYFVTTSAVTTTGQALVSITGLTTGTLSNSTKYEIQVVLDVTTSADAAGIKYGFTAGGGGSAAVVNVGYQSTTTTSAAANATLAAIDTATGNAMTTASENGVFFATGFITTRSTGTATISVQHLKTTSGTSTINIGSVFRIRKAHT